MLNEKDILKGCKDFNPTAQRMLYQKYVARMRAVCVRYARDRDEAKDILQEGFLKIFSNIGKYEESGSLEGWMRKIIVNTSISHYNRNKKYMHESLEDNMLEDSNGTYGKEYISNDPNLFSEAAFTHEELLEALNQLPESHRVVFNMFHLEDFSHSEIAQALLIDEQTSRSRLFRAKKTLQEYLQTVSKRKTVMSKI
jgi:RNA polymerase sigma-70 factor (ECF subfamily)